MRLRRPRIDAARLRRTGSALIAVLAALALLISLGVPFLFSGRLRSEASRETFDRTRARVAIESAAVYAAYEEAGTHASQDPTPLWDDPSEYDPARGGPLPQSLGEEWADSTESWGVAVESLQSRVSLASAPPLVLQNLLHPCFLEEDFQVGDTEIIVTSTAGFPDRGRVFVGTKLIAYEQKLNDRFTGIDRVPEDPNDLAGNLFREGTAIIDARTMNVVLARLQGGEHAAPEFLADLFQDDITGGGLLDESERAFLQARTCLRAGGYGAPEWGPAVWLMRRIDPDFPQRLIVSDVRAFATGTILRIEPDGGETLDLYVEAASMQIGQVQVPIALPDVFPRLSTRLRPLLREPVDLNAAAPEVIEALALGVRLQRGAVPVALSGELPGRPGEHWVSPGKARAFASAVAQARPLEGPDDLWERVLKPLFEEGPLSEFDAWALHLNGLDANNGMLAQSTMPFGYRAGNAFTQRVDAAVRSRFGRTLARAAAEQTTRVAPEGPLLQGWQTQLDFDDRTRWLRGQQGTTTLPYNLPTLGGQHDVGLGLTTRTGTWEPTGKLTPSLRDEDSYITPEPARETDTFGPGVALGRTEHFDFEPSPLGWNVREQGPHLSALTEWNLPVGLVGSNIEPLHMQGWFDLTNSTGNEAFFDLYGPFSADRSRVTAFMEGGELVVRGYDDAGDDPLDPDNLVQAVEVRIDPAEYPMSNRWLHLSVLLRGMSPRGMQVAVDGVPQGEVQGFTHITGAVDQHVAGSPDVAIQVESTEGFPIRGAIRIGNEVIEYSSKTANSFITQPDPALYIGGRAARENDDAKINLLDSAHPAGSGVELYGYNSILASNVPPGGASLLGEVGPFSVAIGAQGPDTISILANNGDSVEVGKGIAGAYIGSLDLAAMPDGDNNYAEAFQTSGGFALLYQPATGWLDTDGFNIGGYEIIEYSQRQGTQITISRRNVTPTGLENAPNWAYDGRARTFVTEWNDAADTITGLGLTTDARFKLHIMPISVKGTNVNDLTYADPQNTGHSEFVQITTRTDAGLTEWVRYDRILNNCFVRDEWTALNAAVQGRVTNENFNIPPFPPGGGGGPGGGVGGGGGSDQTNDPPGPIGGTGSGGFGGGMWQFTLQDPDPGYEFVRRIGQPESGRSATILNILQQFDFRGTMGTYDHPQGGNALLVPVLRTHRPRPFGPWAGFVGRLDRVAMMEPGSQVAPLWYTVQWASGVRANLGLPDIYTWVAFDEHPGQPFIPTTFDPNTDLLSNNFDPRNYTRLVKFPSGERPSGLDSLSLGSEVTAQLPTFNGIIDEFSLHTTGGMGSSGNSLARAAFFLEDDMDNSESSRVAVDPGTVYVDGQLVYGQSNGVFLSAIPPSGILDIDGERVAYNSVDAVNGFLRIAPNGRGLHGTEPRGHSYGTKVHLVDGRASGALVNDLTADDAFLMLDQSAGFAQFPLLLAGTELIHSSFRGPGGELAMPRYRLPAGSTEQYGDGILRGRFGTTAQAHPGGTVVYSMPSRWSDRYVPQSDSPAAAWYQVSFEEPGAFWRGVAFAAEVPDSSMKVRVLGRAGEASWEDPKGTLGTFMIEEGRAPGGGPSPIGFVSDRLDLRVTFDWDVGAFDPIDFLAHGWTQAPRLRNFFVDYLAESRVERHCEVLE